MSQLRMLYKTKKVFEEQTQTPYCAYVGIHTESAHEVPVLKKVRCLDNVEEAFRVYGLYDIVVKVNAETKDDIKQIIKEKIEEIESVRATSTILLMPKDQIIKPPTFQIPSPMIVAASK